MKAAHTILLALSLAVTAACTHSSQKGGDISPDSKEGFKLVVPAMKTVVRQGQVKPVIVSVARDKYFNQSVRLTVISPKGLDVDPSKTTVDAGDPPDVQFVITAPKDAPLATYDVEIRGTPDRGASVAIKFPVTVVMQ